MSRPVPRPPFDLFVTRYSGKCSACVAPIAPGDTVGRVQMQWRRLGCSDEASGAWRWNAVGRDPHPRVCCATCYAWAAVNGDPSRDSLVWPVDGQQRPAKRRRSWLRVTRGEA